MTVNQQTARTIALPDGQTLYLSGMGYNGEGEVPVAGNGGKISETERERLNLLAELAILANEGSLVQEDGGWKHRDDGMDAALAFEGGEPGAMQMAPSATLLWRFMPSVIQPTVSACRHNNDQETSSRVQESSRKTPRTMWWIMTSSCSGTKPGGSSPAAIFLEGCCGAL